MASSQVQVASAHFGCVLRDHNWRHVDKERESSSSNNNNNVRAQQQQQKLSSLEKNLKVLVRDHLHSHIALSGSRGSVSASDENNSGNQVDNREKKDHSFTSQKSTRRRDDEEEEEEEAQVEVEDDESAAPLARKQSRVIDRWATRQARQINTTLERQTHERELMALSNSHPVSTVASTFLADSPRTTTDSPCAPSESSVDLPNLHASSLVRKWRDFEAESKLTSGNNGSLSFNSDSTIISSGDRLNSGSGTSNIDNASSIEEDPSPRSEVCDSGDEIFETPPAQQDSFADWDSEQNTLSTPRERENRSQVQVQVQVKVQRVSDVGESERLRVVDIIRRLTLGKPIKIKTRTSSMNSSSMDETEDRELPTVIDPEPEQQREQRRTGFVKNAAGKSPSLRGRQAMMNLLKQIERQRQWELNQLAERRAVSRFPQRGRIQSMLKLRFLQRLAASQHQQRTPSAASELGSLQPATSIFALRQKFSANKYAGDVHSEESRDSSNSHTQLPNDSKDSEYSGASNQLANEEVHQQMGTTEQESTLPVHHSIPSAGEALQEEDHSSDHAWQGRILLGSNLVQELSINTETTSRDLEGSGATEKPETDSQQLARSTNGTWMDDLSHPQRNWRGSVQSWCEDLLSHNSENGEINVVMDELEAGMQELAGGVGSHSQDWRHSRQEWYEDAPENKSEDGERNFVVVDQQSDTWQLEGSTEGTWLDNRAYPQTYWSEQSWYQNVLETNSENGEMNVTDEQDPDSEHPVGSINGNWQRNVSRPTRDLRRSRQERYQEMLENRSENGEIQELLQRRSVSNFLASDFRETMDQMIKSYLQRQNHRPESIGGEENHFESPHLGASDSSNHFASTSFNLPLSTSYNLPLPSQLRTQAWYQDLEVMENSDQVPSSQSTSVQPFPSRCQDNPQSAIIHPSVEIDLISDLRTHILQLHNEIFELRRSVVSCLDMQNNLQHSIKKEVTAAVYNSVHGGEAIELFNWVPIRKGKCCICYEMQVDSLLYRCGHMCTCFNCAHELQWSSGRCPICRAPILDVVRAYSNA